MKDTPRRMILTKLKEKAWRQFDKRKEREDAYMNVLMNFVEGGK